MADYGSNPTNKTRGKASNCIDIIEAYEKKYGPWMERSKKVVQRYRDERTDEDQTRGFNILWSNIEVLRPTLYARAPSPEVVRRFTDSDPIARIACEIAERATSIEIENGKLGICLKQAVDDRLLPGRGTIWVAYNGTIDETTKLRTNEQALPMFVHWQDYGHNVCRNWEEVKQAWRKVYFVKDAFEKRFPKVPIEKISFTDAPPTASNKGASNSNDSDANQACVYELWDKDDRKVKWISKGYGEEYLDVYDVPVDLQGFFPCPQPLYATITTDTLIPVPDFCQYQDQAYELDKLTIQISNLIKGLKLSGVYDTSVQGLDKLVESQGNIMLPVSNFADLMGKGGITTVMQWIPLADVRNALDAAYTSREQTKIVIYELTGISDILRGASDPRETLGAQQLKAQSGSTRIRSKQDDAANFARDTVRIMAEIICEMYDPVTLWKMTNAESFCVNQDTGQPDPQLFAQAVALLRNDKLRTFRVDIETDSTLALDENMVKQSRTEFVSVMGKFIEPFMANPPPAPMIPLLKETILFLARGYKAGRSLEGIIEKTFDELQKMAAAKAAQPPPPDPKAEAAKAQVAIAAARLRQDGEKNAAQLAQKAQKDQADVMLKKEKQDADIALDFREQQADETLAASEQAFDQALRQAEHRAGIIALLNEPASATMQ